MNAAGEAYDDTRIGWQHAWNKQIRSHGWEHCEEPIVRSPVWEHHTLLESALAKSLTHLDIWGPLVRLEGLMHCTALQYLSIDPHTMQPEALYNKNVSALQNDLQHLQRLTSLRLCGGYVNSSIINGVSALTALLYLSVGRWNDNPLDLPEGSLPVS